VRLRVLAVAALLVVVVGASAAVRSGTRGAASVERAPVVTADRGALDAARSFLDRYLDADGRVVRHDQGADTVSEGQAYAMLIAAAVDDRPRFERAWRWTRVHLQRPDGLLSFLWRDGRVEDPQPASDADLDAARALLLAADRFGVDRYRRDGLRLATGIVQRETASSDAGLLLLAGPWADYGSRLVVNPSYFAPRTYAVLAKATRDGRWRRLAASSRAVVSDLQSGGTLLPPNWAIVGDDSGIRASGPPSDEGEAPKYGFDAARLPLRYAESCDARDRRSAAAVWRVLKVRGIDELSTRHDLDGERDESGVHPVGLVGAAAAASAAGDARTSTLLLARADELDRRSPTYYGAALVALGRLALTTDRLGSCPTGPRG